MEIIPVDPRDRTWEDASPRYRVHFFAGTTSDEYEISGAPDVGAVLAWAEADRDARPYVLYARVDHGAGLGLLRLAGSDPNDD
jgi:hypothetical protein